MRNWWQPSPAGEVTAIPWLAPRVIARLEEIIKPTFHVIEHGCGGSTLWFAARVESVLATDGNEKWREKINAKLDPARARVFASFGEVHPLDAPDNEKFDLMLIDGEPLDERVSWIMGAVKTVKAGGWVVLDNANREILTEARAWLHAQSESVETFDGNEPGTIYLVTDICKLKGKEHANRKEPASPVKRTRRTAKNNVDVRNPSPESDGLPQPTA